MTDRIICPHCGMPISSRHGAVRRTGAVRGNLFAFSPDALSADVVDTMPAFTTLTRTIPARTQTPAGDVIVPLCQSAVTGIVAGAIATMGAYYNFVPTWAPQLGLIGGFAASWLWLLADNRSLLRVTETITGQEQAPLVQQTQQTQTLRLEITEKRGVNNSSMKFVDLPCDMQQLQTIARGVLANKPFSERVWSGHGKTLSSPKFRALQDKLIELGYLRWASVADRRQGVALTHKGEQMMRAITAPSGADDSKI